MGVGRARLVLVGTPIGNLGDVTPRMSEAFAAADVVACEDTRRTGKLLSHIGVRVPRLVRLDDHTESDVAPRLIERIAAGDVVAVTSDAGMPGLSDPGARVAALAAESSLLVEVIPGPFAAAVAIVGSGLLDASSRFCFEGFLPRKGPSRASRLGELVGERRTIVLYEAPHRLERTLTDLAATLGGERRVALCRELTKLHEEFWRGTLSDALVHCGDVAPRGEYVIVVDGAEAPAALGDEELLVAVMAEIDDGSSRRDAAAIVAERHGVAVNRVKGLLLDP